MDRFAMRRLALSTGVELDTVVEGEPGADPIIFLHGFPESHWTWRHQIRDFARDHFVVAPDQRGFASSSKPGELAQYTPAKLVCDVIALADVLGIGRFKLVGHDWGGVIAWLTALWHPERVTRLGVLNAGHPVLFQRAIFDDPGQRQSSQYITAFRNPRFEAYIERIGLDRFFDDAFRTHDVLDTILPSKGVYLEQWSQPGALTGMLNWYRASGIIVPEMDETAHWPSFLDVPGKTLSVPTTLVWGVGDPAVRESTNHGLDTLVDQLTVRRVDAGHFLTWEAPAAVIAALRSEGF